MLIMICDDEPMVRIGLRSMLEELEPSRHTYIEAANGHELLDKISLGPDLAFVDIQMPLLNGLDAIKAAKEISPATRWFVLTGHSQFEYAQQAVKLDISDYLVKPVGIKEIAEVMAAVNKWKDSGQLVQDYLKAITDRDFDVSSSHSIAQQIQEMTGSNDDRALAVDIISKVKAYVHNNYKDDIGVDSIAAHLNITPNYLSRLFRIQTDIKLIDYISEVRIEKAKVLLSNPHVAIKDVAEHVGYYSAKYFSKVFYKLEGKTPSEYQKMKHG